VVVAAEGEHLGLSTDSDWKLDEAVQNCLVEEPSVLSTLVASKVVGKSEE
jgi:hypothetical protein